MLSVHDRINIAETFLSFFPGSQIFISNFDPKNQEGYELEEVEKKPWHYHDNFDNCVEKLFSVNNPQKGRGIFFCVNELDQTKDKLKKRTNKMWVRSRAIWCEDDNTRSDDPNDFRTDWPIIPNLVVNTSPGKFHYYWITDTDDSNDWACVQGRMVEQYGSDNSAKDLARILRLPGFFHLKDPENAHFVNYIKLRDTAYEWEEILKAFPPVEFGNTNTKVEKAKKERIFIKSDPVINILTDLGLIKDKIENGIFDITCPWVNEHTKQEDSGTRLFLPHYNGYDQYNFKCNHHHCAHRTIKDFEEKIHLNDKKRIPEHVETSVKLKTMNRPVFPLDFMEIWPEPWPLIWENWKKIPRDLSQPLLTPTILSLHAYILNSKYITEWGRRPNLYQLNLAESTANKDTNSKDVLRAIGDILSEMSILNTFFNEKLFNSDTNITSDTAFLKMLENNDGNFYWLNTEATRVFQQLNNSSSSNSAVMALSDKIIEVVDGHGITSKAKAEAKIPGCPDPNIQIVFYAQPETIEKYINEEMIDSGFLGRAIITLDDKALVSNKHRMFIWRTSHNKRLDDTLARFYATRTVGTSIKEVFIASPCEKGKEELHDWAEKFIEPLLNQYASENSYMHKMISRIGNTAEQLYAVIVGICREWDMFLGRNPRNTSDISPKCMFPLLEFWSRSKEYVVKEYIQLEADPIVLTIETVLLKMIKGKIKIEKNYTKVAQERGLVPRSILMRSMRNQGKLIKKMNFKDNNLFLNKVSMVLDAMIANEILREEFLARPDRLLKAKKTKYIGFA